MDRNTFLTREKTYAKVCGIVGGAVVAWLAPKAADIPIVWEIATGAMATSATLTAAYEMGRLERIAQFTRAESAAAQDMYANELAHQVMLNQLQLQAQLPTAQPAQLPAQATQAITTKPQTLPDTPPSDAPLLNLNEITYYPALIIFGAQGSGKTTLARLVADHRSHHDPTHTVTVLDPHGSEWPYPVVGSGMDYRAISETVSDLLGQFKSRYLQFGKGERSFSAHTTICDEFTNWSQRIKGDIVVEFLRSCLTDIRKINELAIFLVHANTFEGGLAGAKGLAVLRNNGAIQIELMAQRNPDTGRAEPTGYGKISRPGEGSEWVRIPNASVQPEPSDERLEPSYALGVQPIARTFTNVQNPPVQAVSGGNERSRTPFDWVSPETQQALMFAIANNQPKAATINAVLGISKGGSSAYKKASEDWDAMVEIISSQVA